ncbi:hypothetical protein U2F10_23435 [Leptothoe sp. EHU-05/26/07-4]
MSLNSRRGQSVANRGESLRFFTDRHEFVRLLVERINQDSAQSDFLFWYGEGGNGKSLLLKYLAKNACRRLISADQWAALCTQSDVELARSIGSLPVGTYHPIPVALLDFNEEPPGEEQPRDPVFGPLMLRKKLAASASGNHRLVFPRFDFACLWYLSQTGRSVEQVRALFPLNELAGLATTVMDAVSGNPVGALIKAVFDFGAQGLSETLTLKFQSFGLDRQTLETIRQADKDTELIERLPELLAQDLNQAMAADNGPSRMVLMFDAHEKFWGDQRNVSSYRYFEQDAWLRRLLRELNTEAGIIPVITGRSRPRWSEADQSEVPNDALSLKRVGNFTTQDAQAYLTKIEADTPLGLTDAALQESLIAYAMVLPGEVHPLYLALCVDVVREAKASGQTIAATEFKQYETDFHKKGLTLIRLLMKYVDADTENTIYALSACRSFNKELFQVLGKALNFATFDAVFQRVTQFSFVWSIEEGDQPVQYRIHDLMRRLNDDPRTQSAHRLLTEHYRQLGNIEAVYHLNQLDWSQGVDLWVTLFEEMLKVSRYEMCRALLDMRRELLIQSDFKLGLISDAEGQYYQSLSMYGAAQREYEEAIAAYNHDLEENPESTSSFNNKGNSLQRLADLQAVLSHHGEAQASYGESIAAYDAALQRAPDLVQALNNKGLSLQRLADLQAGLSQHGAAMASYGESIAAYDAALQRAPDYINALNNKGLTCIKFGIFLDGQEATEQISLLIQDGLACWNRCLEIVPDNTNLRELRDRFLAMIQSDA